MSWQGIRGHDAVVAQFRRAFARDRLGSTFLFLGPPGIGKRTFALKFAQAMLCERNPPEQLEPCGLCDACVQVTAGTHPDVDLIGKPTDKSAIPVALLIGDKEHRMSTGLCYNISMKPFRGGRKLAIIDDADYLNQEGANCLLKTLEEPPPRSVLILIGTSSEKQLPTIRSRCQTIRFEPLAEQDVYELVLQQKITADVGEARRLAQHCGGSLTRAAELADADLWQFRAALAKALAKNPLESVVISRDVNEFIEAAGKEPSARRARLRMVIGFATEFFHAALVAATGGSSEASEHDLQPLATLLANRSADTEQILGAIERCLEAGEQLERNANLTTLVECWLDDLARTLAPLQSATAQSAAVQTSARPAAGR